MTRHLLEAKEGVRLSIYTGMLEYGHPDRMSTLHFYRAYSGSKISLLDKEYEYALAVYKMERDNVYIYTYAYQENECWAVYDESIKSNEYHQQEFVFDNDCYFRINVRRKNDRILDASEAAHINDIICFETLYPVETNNEIKAYLKEEIENTSERIKTALNEEGTKAFLILTDSHYVVNGTWEDTLSTIREVNNRVDFSGIIHLGDLTDGMVSRKVLYDYVGKVKTDLSLLNKPLYIVMGNHDSNYFRGNKERITKEEQYWLYQSDCCGGSIREAHSLYYYKDFDDINIRGIFLHSFDECQQIRYGFSNEELIWLTEVLKSVPQNYRVLVFSHVPPLPQIHFWSKDIRNGEEIVNILENYVKEDSTHRVIAWIHGHNHADQVYNERLFPIISLGCTKIEDFKDKKPDNSITYDRKFEDPSQELWNTLIINKESTKLKFIRFGAGEDIVVN